MEKFYNKIIVEDDCWIWVGASRNSRRGIYGAFRINGKQWAAHRFSYHLHKGDIGDLLVCHVCDKPLCVNPDHLFLGTHMDNMVDAMNKGIIIKSKHPSLSDYYNRGCRCIECKRIASNYMKKYYRNNKDKWTKDKNSNRSSLTAMGQVQGRIRPLPGCKEEEFSFLLWK